MTNYNTNCIYPRCRFKCFSEHAHRARYANITKPIITKNKVKNKVKPPSNKINWKQLETIGVVYELPSGHKSIDYEKLNLKSVYP